MPSNKLLQKQITKFISDELINNHPELKLFLQAVNNSYNSYEKDIELSNHAFLLSEKEYRAINTKLAKEIGQKKLSIQKLKQTIQSIDTNSNIADDTNDDILDVTEYFVTQLHKRKLAETELLKSASLIGSLLKNLHAAILVENENRQIVLTNQMFCEMFNIPVPPDMLIGVDCSQSAEQSKTMFLNPNQFVKNVEEILIHKQIVKDEVLELADGRFFERDYIPIYVEDVYKGHLWTYRDITERRTAEEKIKLQEEKYRSIIANMNLGLLEVDLEDKVIYVNQSFCEMCGFSAEELIGQKAAALFVKHPNEISLIKSKGIERTKGVSDSYEMKVLNKNKENRWWLISGAPLYNNEKNQVGSIGIHLDITEQKELETQLKEAKVVAEKSAKAKEIFLTNMSHEIRTPMNAIIGMGHQLMKTDLSGQQQSYLSAINTASKNLLVIINDILDFSKIDEGKVVLENIGFNIRIIIEEAIQIIKLRAEEKGLSLNANIDSKVSAFFKGDPYRINQILMNLLSNAIKFTEKGSVTINCLLKESLATTQQLEISVTDTGKGIDDSFLTNIFNEFTQEDESIVRNYGGTGLGMSITKQLVELMNGTIEVQSKKGVGTSIIVNLNLPKATIADMPKAQNAKLDATVLKDKKILLVEDNEMNRFVASVILAQYGAIVSEAHNGSDAISYLENDYADLILMDMRMPVMDGLEATKRIRESIDKQVPIIALTANTIKTEKEKCEEAGMNDYIGKPFVEDELINTITLWVSKNLTAKHSKKTKPQEPLYKLDKLNNISKNNEAFIKKILNIFRNEATTAITKIKTGISTNDVKIINETAHRLKPSLDNLCVTSLAEIIRKLELLTTNELDNPQTNIAVEKFEQIINAIIEDLATRNHI